MFLRDGGTHVVTNIFHALGRGELNRDNGGYEVLHVSTVATRAALLLAGGELGLGEPVVVYEVVAVRPPVSKRDLHDSVGSIEGVATRLAALYPVTALQYVDRT